MLDRKLLSIEGWACMDGLIIDAVYTGMVKLKKKSN